MGPRSSPMSRRPPVRPNRRRRRRRRPWRCTRCRTRCALRQTLESSGILLVTTMVFGDVSGSSLTVAMPTVLLETGFSRGHEQEADDFAFALLKRKGISANAFADMLGRLQRKHGAEPDGASYFSTHPATKQRIARARAAAK